MLTTRARITSHHRNPKPQRDRRGGDDLVLAERNVRAVDEAVFLHSISITQVAHGAFVDGSLECAQVEVVPQRKQHIGPAHCDCGTAPQRSLAPQHSRSRSLTPSMPKCVCLRQRPFDANLSCFSLLFVSLSPLFVTPSALLRRQVFQDRVLDLLNFYDSLTWLSNRGSKNTLIRLATGCYW